MKLKVAILTIIWPFLLDNIGFCQNLKVADFYAFTIHPKGLPVMVYDYINRDIVMKIMSNKQENNAGQVVHIIGVENNWFKLDKCLVDEDLWIKSGDLGVFARNFHSTLILFEKPELTSTKIQLYENNEILIVKDFFEDWVSITTNINGVKYEGWLPKDKTCSSPFTTCP